MSNYHRRAFFGLAIVGIGVAGGCSGKSSNIASAESAVLREVEMMLRMPSPKMKSGSPDLTPFQHDFPVGYKAVQSGDVVVAWGVQMPDEGAGGGSDEIIAYEKKVSSEGGHVLLMNGTIKKMTPAEFQAAPKAKK